MGESLPVPPFAFEALYDIGRDGDKSLRIATYVARHLGKDFQERKDIHDTLRDVYGKDSTVIRGGDPDFADEQFDQVSEAENVCREGILRQLKNPATPNWESMILNDGACPQSVRQLT
ncbi:MAG: hypothetical protein OXC91_06995 [Rhodobacteraceae bacterium]|nr:hypothetical protein [Paracoccaceae bacterium]